jgi:hypothetical protein
MDRSRIDCPSYRIELRRAIARWLPLVGLPLISWRRWSDRLLTLVMLMMVWSPQAQLGDRFREARAAVVGMYPTRRRPGRTFAGFMSIMARHSPRLLVLITTHLRARMPGHLGRDWMVGRWRVFTVDGSKIDCPRTRANQKHFKCGGRHKSGPQLLLTVLIHLRSGILWSWRQAIATGSERTLLRDLLKDLPADSLLVADAGFVGYDLLGSILRQGHSVLMRVGANVRLLKELGYAVKQDKDTVYLWPDRAQRHRQPPLVVRLIVVKKGRKKMTLVTNATQGQLSDAQAAELYQLRWGVELSYRALKQTLQRGKMLSDSPGHAMVELDWTLLGQWILSLMHWTHQPVRSRTPVHEGTAQALRIVRQAMGAGRGRKSLAAQLRAIRPDRYERKRSKRARHYPQKKKDSPCGIPKIRTATKRQVKLAKRLATQQETTYYPEQ